MNEIVNARNRTLFYSTIGRLLFTDESMNKSQSFVISMHQVRNITVMQIRTTRFRFWKGSGGAKAVKR